MPTSENSVNTEDGIKDLLEAYFGHVRSVMLTNMTYISN